MNYKTGIATSDKWRYNPRIKKGEKSMASIQKLENGSYRAIISCGKDENGKRIRVSKVYQARNQKEAEKQAVILEERVRNGLPISEQAPTIAPLAVCSQTKEYVFKDIVEKWRENRASGDYVTKTVLDYESILENFMLPYFGEFKLSEINYEQVKKYMKRLDMDGIRLDGKKGGYSDRTKDKHKMMIQMFLNEAVRYGCLERVPDLSGIKRKVCKKNMNQEAKENYLTEDELQLLLKKVSERKKKANGEECQDIDYWQHKMFVHLIAWTGIRLSEACGLEFKDIDFENNTISLKRTSHYADKKIYTQNGLKNGDTGRTIKVDAKLIELLSEYKNEMNKIWEEKRRQQKVRKNRINYQIVDSDRLFTKHDGSPINPHTLSSWFVRQVKEWNIVQDENRRITVHGLRHTYATLLISSGIDIATVSKCMGHDSITTTIQTYSHLLPDGQQKCADAMGKIMGIL